MRRRARVLRAERRRARVRVQHGVGPDDARLAHAQLHARAAADEALGVARDALGRLGGERGDARDRLGEQAERALAEALDEALGAVVHRAFDRLDEEALAALHQALPERLRE